MAHVLTARGITLALTDDAGIECILTGIPLLCLGILSLGVFTFVLATRRTGILISVLFTSAFLGFVAAILDLSQILARGYSNTTNGLQLGQVAGLIRSREVFLSLSVCCLFLFYWLFSSHRPMSLADLDTGAMVTEKGNMATTAGNADCARWERWGFVGIVLKWSSLTACLLIAVLQLVWRLTRKHHFYGDLYVASATLETVISIVFILKLILNSYLAAPESRRQVLLGYVAPVLSFVLSAGIGIGNLVVFSFSETSLGRFLRGVEVYILLVYYLIATFRDPTPTPKDPSLAYEARGGEGYIGPEKGGPGDNHGQTGLPYESFIQNAGANPPRATWQLYRVSHISRISSWVGSRRASRKSLGGDQMPNSPRSPPKRSILFQQSAPASPAAADRNGSSNGSSFISPPPPLPQSNRSSMQFFSYYGLDRTGKSATFRDDNSTVGSDSPIYGLDGIIVPPKKTKASKLVEVSMEGPSEEVTPVRMTHLMQEQADIDKSIEALRGQTAGDTGKDESKLTAQRLKAAQLTPDQVTSPLASSKPSSPTNLSEFSLSVFPEPPAPAIVSPTSLRELPSRTKVARPDISKRVPPIQVDAQARESDRYDSPPSGTRYDVTSFIGGFALPSSGYPASSALNSSTGVLVSGSTVRDAPRTTFGPITRETPGRVSPTATENANSQYVVLSRTPSRPLGSATMSSSLNRSDWTGGTEVPAQNLALRTFLTRNESTTRPSGPL